MPTLLPKMLLMQYLYDLLCNIDHVTQLMCISVDLKYIYYLYLFNQVLLNGAFIFSKCVVHEMACLCPSTAY